MKFHIVQVNEKISDIAKNYNISVDEIIKQNRHINNIHKIVPGMKLRLPVLSDEVNEELKDNSLDIEKYYPKLEDFQNDQEDVEVKNMDIEQEEVPQNNENYQQQPQQQQPQQSYYQNPYYNPYYQQQQQAPNYYYPYQTYQPNQYYGYPRLQTNEEHPQNENQGDLIYQHAQNERDENQFNQGPFEQHYQNHMPQGYQLQQQYVNQPYPNQGTYQQPNQMPQGYSYPTQAPFEQMPYQNMPKEEQVDSIFGPDVNLNYEEPVFPQFKERNETIKIQNENEQDFDDDDMIKEIHVDLRKVHKKTKIKKKASQKKDPLDLL